MSTYIGPILDSAFLSQQAGLETIKTTLAFSCLVLVSGVGLALAGLAQTALARTIVPNRYSNLQPWSCNLCMSVWTCLLACGLAVAGMLVAVQQPGMAAGALVLVAVVPLAFAGIRGFINAGMIAIILAVAGAMSLTQGIRTASGDVLVTSLWILALGICAYPVAVGLSWVTLVMMEHVERLAVSHQKIAYAPRPRVVSPSVEGSP